MDIPAIYDRLAELAFKKGRGQLSEEEARELNDILESSSHKKELFEEMMDPEKTVEDLMIMEEYDVEASWEIINQPVPPLRKKWGRVQYTWAAAATIVLVTGLVALYFFLEKNKKPDVVQNEKVSTGNTAIRDSVAIITNSDGSTMAVGQSQSGTIGYINGEPVIKKDKVLICPDIGTAGTVIKTLPGKELQVQLSDGTMAWLSGSSELSFSTGYTASDRELLLAGEAYFEVAKKSAEPFVLTAWGMKVTVLGTRFTISAYGNQGFVTTSLFEGKVKLTAGGETMLLSPNEEAIFQNNTFLKKDLAKHSINKMNGKKTGRFIFDDDIKTILEEIGKNYDCIIEYKGVIPGKTFSGNIPRNMPIETLLRNLSGAMSIVLTLQGNKIVADFTQGG
jgi:transmembrane sensor